MPRSLAAFGEERWHCPADGRTVADSPGRSLYQLVNPFIFSDLILLTPRARGLPFRWGVRTKQGSVKQLEEEEIRWEPSILERRSRWVQERHRPLPSTISPSSYRSMWSRARSSIESARSTRKTGHCSSAP